MFIVVIGRKSEPSKALSLEPLCFLLRSGNAGSRSGPRLFTYLGLSPIGSSSLTSAASRGLYWGFVKSRIMRIWNRFKLTWQTCLNARVVQLECGSLKDGHNVAESMKQRPRYRYLRHSTGANLQRPTV